MANAGGLHVDKEGKASVVIQTQIGRRCYYQRLYTDLDITKEGIQITATATAPRGRPVVTRTFISWQEIISELARTVKKELKKIEEKR